MKLLAEEEERWSLILKTKDGLECAAFNQLLAQRSIERYPLSLRCIL